MRAFLAAARVEFHEHHNPFVLTYRSTNAEQQASCRSPFDTSG
jgi:hypothetical protein